MRETTSAQQSAYQATVVRPQQMQGAAMDFSHFQWSQEGQHLKASSLADLVNQFRGVEGVITLHAGLPCPTSFPLTTISATTSSTSISQAHTPGAPACSGGSSPSQPPLYGLASQRPRPWWQFSLAPPSPHSCDTSNGRQAAPVPCHGDQQGSSGALCSGAHPASHSPCPSHPDHASTNGTHPVKNGAAHVNGLNGLAKGGEQALASSQHPHQQQQQQQQPSGQDGASSQGTGDLHISGQLVSDAQQYMFHSGHPPLLHWARQIVDACHAPPCSTQCVATSGAVHALNCAISCLCDRGDFIICEEFAYTHAPECVFIPRGLNMLPVTMDEQGMVPDALRRVLKSAGVSPMTGRPPRVIYIIPSGQNPTGAVMGVERKREIYEICRSHSLVILEDDAYYWLQYPQGAQPESRQPGLCLPPTFLSMDVDGRVLRIDTFAKLLGPGYRLGWITAPPPLAARMASAVQASCCGPSSLSQVVVSELLNMWGIDGFEAFVRKQQAMYARRATAASAAAEKHLKGLVTFASPKAGMFMWFKLTGLPDFGPELVEELVAAKVVVVPGRPFWTDTAAATNSGTGCPYFRATFGSVDENMVQEGFARLATALKAAMGKAGLPAK